MAYAPPPPPPRHVSLEQQIAKLEPRLRRRRSRLGFRQRSAYRSCLQLIRLREHLLYGEHRVYHAGRCPLGESVCGIPSPPIRLPPSLAT